MPITPTNTLTSQVLGSIALAGAEISAYDAASQRVLRPEPTFSTAATARTSWWAGLATI